MTFSLIESQFKEFVLSDPDNNIGLGETQFLGQLGDPSLEGLEKTNNQAQALLSSMLQTKKTETLSFDESLDLDLMIRYLGQMLFFNNLTQNGQLQRCRKPNGVDGISAGIFQLFVNDERTEQARLDDILSRLKQAPDYLKTELSVISEPITRWRDIEVEQGEGLADLFTTIRDWAQQTNYGQLAELDVAINKANSSIEQYINTLKEKQTIDDFIIGEDKVLELLELREIHQSPKQLADMAKSFMLETNDLLDELTIKLAKKYSLPVSTSQEYLHEFLNEKYAAKISDGNITSVLNYYTQQIESIQGFINKNKLFEIPKDQTMKIMQTPSFLEPVIPAGAMWPPLALREGKKTSLVYLTLKHDQLAEHSELGIPVMMIHEGIPGHHLQFATAALHSSFVRRIFSANEHAEGWTTMLEDYMLDIGYIQPDLVDEVRFIAKREMSRLVARVGIDLYFMTGNKQYLDVGLDLTFDSEDVFVNAAKLLKKATGFTDGRVQAELNWYSTEQSYPLSYLTGNQLVWQLKDEIKQKNKKELNETALDQAFHDVYLTSGCMPVNSLRKVYAHLGYL
ncbi:DUF885 family protein [Oceaniserpentilla sp. 4NH20-0058]|uniref:DUF885 family protein n=1 Tax=Oceaniserpentilla sp. 4NH20-0058 TaxID=3127660 RepID=UPI0033405FED